MRSRSRFLAARRTRRTRTAATRTVATCTAALRVGDCHGTFKVAQSAGTDGLRRDPVPNVLIQVIFEVWVVNLRVAVVAQIDIGGECIVGDRVQVGAALL